MDVYLILTPPLTKYLETFWLTHKSAATEEELNRGNMSLEIPIITSIPLPISALNSVESASKSFTFCILLCLKRSTTLGGASLWDDRVPQFTPMPASTIGAVKKLQRITRHSRVAAAILSPNTSISRGRQRLSEVSIQFVSYNSLTFVSEVSVKL